MIDILKVILPTFSVILFGYFFYGEVMNIQELLGGILIVVSVVKMNQLKN